MISSFTPILKNVYHPMGLLFVLGLGLSGQPVLAQSSSVLWIGQTAEVTEEQVEEAEEYNQQGIQLVESGQYIEAVEAFNRALEIYPNSEKIYSNLGIALGYDRRFSEAVQAFEEALRINPQNWETYNNLGIALGNQEQYEEAIAAFDRAIAINPNAPMSYHNSAVAYLKQEKWQQAISSLEAAREKYLAQGQTEVVDLIDRVLSDLQEQVLPVPSESETEPENSEQ